MKRKIFSKLLMVALVIAAVGSFVSCKDYDDDINNLQKQIDAKAALSELTALQSTLDSKIAAAQSAAQAAQATADAAATKTALADLKSALETAIADAKKAGTDAGTQAGNAITAANKAQETADGAAAAAKKADEDAKAALADALKTISETYETKADAAAKAAEAKGAIDALKEALAAVKQTADAAYTKAQAEKLQEQVDGLKADLESTIEEKVKEAIKDVENAKASVDAIWSAVTSIEFVVDNWGVINNSPFLNFQFGKQLDNVFGNGKELHAYDVTDKPETYTAGKDIKAENVYFVRVSPVNADLSDADIKLVNSLGEDLGDFVNIKVEAYKELLTRATETGLWKVTVTLKDGADREKLQKAATVKLSRDKKRTISSALYAIAAGNSQDAAADRFAVTPYRLQVWTNDYTPTDDLQFTVNDVDIDNIYNRWDATNKCVVAEDQSKERDSLYWELAWNTPDVAEKFNFDIPAVKAITDIAYDATAKKGVNNYVPAPAIGDFADDRRDEAKLQVQPEEQIVIKFDLDEYPYVDRYYVQFDKDNAIESAPSEFESWLSYNATGLFTMKKSSERLILTVPADAAEGDIVGFRLYAVNYDGTLVDPDGKAFYVQVGFVPNAEEADIVSGTFTARVAGKNATAKEIIQNKANGVIIPFDFSAKYPSIYKDTKVAGYLPAIISVDPDKEQNEDFITTDGTFVDIYYLKSNELNAKGAAQTATTVGEIKYVALNVQDPQRIIDDKTIETDAIEVYDADKHDKVIGYFSFLLTKGEIDAIDPTSTANDDLASWKSGQTGTLYPNLSAASWTTAFTAAANSETFNLVNYMNGLDKYFDLTKFKWTVSAIADADGDLAAADMPELSFTGTAQKLTATTTDAVSTTNTGVATGVTLKATPALVQFAKSILVTISTYTKLGGLSRSDLETADDDLKAGNAHNYDSFTVTLGNVVLAQEYEWAPYYVDGKVGAEATSESSLTKYANILFAQYSGDLKLYNSWTSAQYSGGKVTAVAVQDYLTTGKTAKTVPSIFAKSSNSAVETFWKDAAWAKSQYVGFADVNYPLPTSAAITGFWVESEDGTHNEYIEPSANFDSWAEIENDIEFKKVGAAPLLNKINQKLVIYTKDAFGNSEKFEIPFELVP